MTDAKEQLLQSASGSRRPDGFGQELPKENKQCETREGEIPGIAMLEEEGKIAFTLRDIKAQNKTNAWVRLALLATYVHEELTGETEISRSKVVNPLLKDWRAFDGRVRQAIADHKGIISIGKGLVKLDRRAKEEAKAIMQQVLDPKVEGKWSPRTSASRGKSPKARPAKDSQ